MKTSLVKKLLVILLILIINGVANGEIKPYSCTDNVSIVYMGDKSSLVEHVALQQYYDDNKPEDIFGIPKPMFFFICGLTFGVIL